MQNEPLIAWREPILHLLEFLGLFLMNGAVGFRFSALRSLSRAGMMEPAERDVYHRAARLAAIVGMAGSLVAAVAFIRYDLPEAALAEKVGTLQALHGATLLHAAMLGLGALGFVVAAAGPKIGWFLAVVGVIVGQLRNLFFLPLARSVNPTHMLVAGLWIGTLFVLVTAGLYVVLRDEPSRARRGTIVADMVNGFSPLALICGGILVLSGLVTSWIHLKTLSALWTTPYGYALIAKLCVVAVVFGLGAWNWRRMRPKLGSEDAARAIRRSATGELLAAGVVLVITSVLLSLPDPKVPAAGEPPTPAPATQR